MACLSPFPYITKAMRNFLAKICKDLIINRSFKIALMKHLFDFVETLKLLQLE